ncbi:MAG TPA: hypothetical protein PLM59_00195 [Oscillospiraceae bacterium]|jgi:predicted membrane protein|nr:hypothetical protein [Oscillospiraceae bacterium]MDN5378101.1 hypothetical protein [Clostridiales bacterium]HOV40188.1 hypothetical protein [Oscillospiraceae bacterium]
MTTNYLFPLPLPLHIAFCIISFLFFGAQYLRKKYTYHLLLSFAVPSTLLIYACSSDWAFTVFGFEQLVLYILILVSIFLTKKKVAKEEEQSQNLLEEKSDENSDS